MQERGRNKKKRRKFMLKSDTIFFIDIEFNRPISDEQRKKLSVESITVKAYDNIKKKYKTAKIKPLDIDADKTNDEYTVTFYCCHMQPLTKMQLKETDVSYIEKGTIEIGGITDDDLKPTSVKNLIISTFPDMINAEIVQHALCNQDIDQRTCTLENFEIEINDGSSELAIEYTAERQTRKNFNIIVHKPAEKQ